MKIVFSTLPQYLEYLQSQGKYSFSRKEAIAVLNLSDNAFKKSAYYLMRKSKLIRIRGDFYTIVPPEYRVSGSLPVTWFIDDFMNSLGQDYYCSLLTAASLLGVSHQQPMVFQVITNKKTRPIRKENLQIEFYYKKTIQQYFYQPIKTPTGTINVSTPEVTAFDLIRYIYAAGHINNVATVLCELVSQLNPEKLAALIANDDVEVATAQRLGYLFDSLKLSIDLEPLKKAIKGKNVVNHLLVAKVDQPIIERNNKWHILVNETVEPDEL